MSFIPDLEVHLRDAAAHRRERARRRAIASLATAVGAAVLATSLLLMGGGDERRAGDRPAAEEPRPEGVLPVGAVIQRGEGTPPRDSDSTVVATGTAPVAGRWQLEVSRAPGAPPQRGEARGRCLLLHRLDLLPGDQFNLSGSCGELGFRQTPGFSRHQHNVPTLRKLPSGRLILPKEVLVFGRAPERARKVVVTGDRGVRIEVDTDEGPKSIRGDFFVVPVKPRLGQARINWLDADGLRGSRGIALQPPVANS